MYLNEENSAHLRLKSLNTITVEPEYNEPL